MTWTLRNFSMAGPCITLGEIIADVKGKLAQGEEADYDIALIGKSITELATIKAQLQSHEWITGTASTLVQVMQEHGLDVTAIAPELAKEGESLQGDFGSFAMTRAYLNRLVRAVTDETEARVREEYDTKVIPRKLASERGAIRSELQTEMQVEPGMPRGPSGTQKTYKDMTPDERAALTPDQIDAMVKHEFSVA